MQEKQKEWIVADTHMQKKKVIQHDSACKMLCHSKNIH